MESKNNNNSDDVIQLGLGEGSGRQESLLAFAGIGGLPQSMTHSHCQEAFWDSVSG